MMKFDITAKLDFNTFNPEVFIELLSRDWNVFCFTKYGYAEPTKNKIQNKHGSTSFTGKVSDRTSRTSVKINKRYHLEVTW